MKIRNFSDLGWRVSEIGLGCWAIGSEWGDVSDDDARKTLKTSLDEGINFFDTADVYGDGRSEKFVGELLKSTSEKIYVATKTGRRLDPHNSDGYNINQIEPFVDRSLLNLGVESVDLMQLHCPPTEAYSKDETYSMMDELVKKGKIQYYGVSVETVEEALEAIKRPNIKSVQIIFNIFRQKPAEKFFIEASKKNVAIIVRVPLASGLLTGKMNMQSKFPNNDHRNYNIQGKAFDVGETFAGVPYHKGIEAVEELKKIIPEGFTLVDMSLKWILSHPEVTVVIPGAKNSDQAQLNTKASDQHSIENLMNQIQEIYTNIIKPDVHHRW